MPINHSLALRFAGALSSHAQVVLAGGAGEHSSNHHLTEMTVAIAIAGPDALDRFVLTFLDIFHRAKVQVDPGFGVLSERRLNQIGDRNDS